jgi:hypothetical protein
VAFNQLFTHRGHIIKRWRAYFLSFILVLFFGGASLFFLVPFGGALIIGIPPVFDRLTAYAICPDAADYSYRDYGFGQPTTSRPSGGTGHYTELTCTYKDGSQNTFPNEEVALKGIGASFVAAGICGGVTVLILAVLAGILGSRLVKTKTY